MSKNKSTKTDFEAGIHYHRFRSPKLGRRTLHTDFLRRGGVRWQLGLQTTLADRRP